MATALALSRVVAARRKSGAEPLTFGMTFPFSTHNYQLRFWMAAGGVDQALPDLHLVGAPRQGDAEGLAHGHAPGSAAAWAAAAALPTLAFWAYFAAKAPSLQALGYACAYIGAILALALALFEDRELN